MAATTLNVGEVGGMIRHPNAPTLVEVAKTCGVSELLAGGVSECTILDLQDSLLNSGSLSNSSAPQHRNTTNTLLRLTEVLRQGEAASPQLRSLVLSGLPLADDGAAMLAAVAGLALGFFAGRKLQDAGGKEYEPRLVRVSRIASENCL